MVLDRYGVGGESSYSEIEVYRPTRIVNDIMFFDKIVWDTDGGGNDYFSFAVVADSIDTQTKEIIDEVPVPACCTHRIKHCFCHYLQDNKAPLRSSTRRDILLKLPSAPFQHTQNACAL